MRYPHLAARNRLPDLRSPGSRLPLMPERALSPRVQQFYRQKGGGTSFGLVPAIAEVKGTGRKAALLLPPGRGIIVYDITCWARGKHRQNRPARPVRRAAGRQPPFRTVLVGSGAEPGLALADRYT